MVQSVRTWYEAVEPAFLDSVLEIGNAFRFTTTCQAEPTDIEVDTC